MKKSTIVLSTLLISSTFVGCANNNINTPTNERNITVAKAQSELKKGQTSAEVIAIMGSPNIISTNKNGNEVWVYDKISTQSAKSSSGINLGILPSLIVGGGSNTSSQESSQRTLTVIVKFDENKTVSDIAYHTSRF